MNKIVSTVSAITVLAMACSPAFADDPANTSLQITGSVSTIATLPEPVRLGGSNSSLVGNEIQITSIATPQLTPQLTTITVNYPNVTTNYNTNVTLTSANGGIINSAATPSGDFTNIVHYTATATKDDGTTNLVSLDTSAESTATSTTVVEPFSGNVQIDVILITDNGGKKLLEGSYSDTLT
ncbi:MAG: hypothetical protein P8Y67_05940, partial [Alphaproteobacteria bacterium]